MNRSDFWNDLQQLRTKGSFCDVRLCVGGEAVSCHRVILASTCDYFRSMFTGTFREMDQVDIDLSYALEDISLLVTIVDSIYGKEVEFTEDNVWGLLKAARFLLFKRLVDQGERYLKKKLSVANCVTTWRIAYHLALESIEIIAADLISARFQYSLHLQREMLSVTPDELKALIKAGAVRHASKVKVTRYLTGYAKKHNLSGIQVPEYLEICSSPSMAQSSKGQSTMPVLVHLNSGDGFIDAFFDIWNNRWLTWPDRYFPDGHQPVLVYGSDNIVLQCTGSNRHFICHSDQPRRLMPLPPPQPQEIWCQFFEMGQKLWRVTLLEHIEIGCTQIVAESFAPDVNQWSFRGTLYESFDQPKFCGVRLGTDRDRFFLFITKESRSIFVLSCWVDRGEQQTLSVSLLPILCPSTGDLTEVEPCVYGAEVNRIVIIVGSSAYHFLDSLVGKWQQVPLSCCQHSPWRQFATRGARGDNEYMRFQVCRSLSNQPLLYWNDPNNTSEGREQHHVTPIPFSQLGRFEGHHSIGRNTLGTLRTSSWMGQPEEESVFKSN